VAVDASTSPAQFGSVLEDLLDMTILGEGPRSVVSVLADGTAVVTFLGIALVAVFGSRLREIVIGSIKARSLRRIDGIAGNGLRERCRLRLACHREIKRVGDSAEEWSVSRELLWLTSIARPAASGAQFTWGEADLAGAVAQGLRAYARKLELDMGTDRLIDACG
jgi:hypothetical protein